MLPGIQGIHPTIGASAAAAPSGWTDETSGALAYRTSNTAISANAAAPWDAEIYDTASWHDNSVNPERLTVPSGPTLARVIGNTRSATGGYWYLLKNGAAFDGQGYERSDTDGNEGTNIASAIVAVSAADYFTIHTVGALTLTATGGIISDDGQSWFAVEAVSANRPYALVKKSGDQGVGPADTWVTMTFDQEVADTSAFHDTVTNNSRFTIPVGVPLVRLSTNIRFDGSGAGKGSVQLLKNGSVFDGSFRKEETGATVKYLSATSAIIAVTPGDYFELQVMGGDTGNVIAGEATWFQIEAVHPDTKFAVATAAAVSTSASFNNVALSTEAEDTHGFHDPVTNNSRLTIPAGQGITQARLSFNLYVDTANQLIGRVTKNGGTSIMIPGLPCDECQVGGHDAVGGFGAWIDVDDGDYFELQAFSGSGTDVSTPGQNWLCIETR